jgi:hypothetical protein
VGSRSTLGAKPTIGVMLRIRETPHPTCFAGHLLPQGEEDRDLRCDQPMADRPQIPWMIRACPWRLVKDALFGAPRRGEGVAPSSLSNLQGQAEWPPWGLGGGVGGTVSRSQCRR